MCSTEGTHTSVMAFLSKASNSALCCSCKSFTAVLSGFFDLACLSWVDLSSCEKIAKIMRKKGGGERKGAEEVVRSK